MLVENQPRGSAACWNLAALLLLFCGAALARDKPDPTLRSILLEQLRATHSVEDWFGPLDIVLADLTPEQANWSPGNGCRSVAQLATHLIFWDERALSQFKGIAPSKFGGNNAETFEPVDEASWPATIRKLDEIMKEWEAIVETADEAKLEASYSTIAHIGTHNAYHVGQMLYVRKLQGSWDPEKGVK